MGLTIVQIWHVRCLWFSVQEAQTSARLALWQALQQSAGSETFNMFKAETLSASGMHIPGKVVGQVPAPSAVAEMLHSSTIVAIGVFRGW